MNWWLIRPVQTHGLGPIFPELLPDLQTLEWIYDDFPSNYRAMEAWHMRHRTQILKAAVKENSKKAFQQVLGGDVSLHVDSFAVSAVADIVNVDPVSFHATLSQDMEMDSMTTWTLDDVPATVTKISPGVFDIESDLLFPGQQLKCTRRLGRLTRCSHSFLTSGRVAGSRSILPPLRIGSAFSTLRLRIC